MWNIDYLLRQAKRTWMLLALLTVIHASQLMTLSAAERSSGSMWIKMTFVVSTPHVKLMHRAEKSFNPDAPTFVITHGMGGVEAGDRFHVLADAVSEVAPDSNVLIVNWSDYAWKTGYLGIPDPWAVAKEIEPVAQEASELLQKLKINSEITTFIGESFGTCVNARIAEHLGGRGTILAFNPPNPSAGYPIPNLCDRSDVAWSFHTHSVCDTQESIADARLFLETPANACEKDQHTFGISWLAKRVQDGQLEWLMATHLMLQHLPEHFDAVATLSGNLRPEHVPHKRPTSAKNISRPEKPLLIARDR